ncbi:MAG: efflux RND transporter periplasmic adaptor subunit [Rhodopila sp.]|nr:efflux RND transporter periplasmic adaptor subunit [Rhodopila sp.]
MSISTAARGAFFLAGAALACSLASCKRTEPSNNLPPTDVSVIRVQPQNVNILAEVPGRTVAYRVAQVRPQVSGVLLKRMFEEGTTVTEGQQLYQIDPAPYQEVYDQAQGTLAHDQAAIITARARVDRYRDLAKANAVSRQDYDDALASEREAVADIKTAQAAVNAAAINLNYTKMLSPISGRISRSAVTEGALVTANQATPLATVTQLDPIYVDITQSSADLLPLRRQLQSKNLSANSGVTLPVELTLEDGKSYGLQGKLSFAEVNVDEGTGTTALRAIFPNPDHLLLPGMYVRATLHEGTNENAYLVPQNAVQRNIHADPYVYIVDGKDQVEERLVQLNGNQDNNWVVVKGLNPGDRIITKGLQKVTPGAHVHPTEAALQAHG